ncbi:MAG: response regulator [Gemmataceae bacterium]
MPATLVARAAVTVVDDEPSALDVLLRAARSWQFECQGAASAEEALRLLEQNPTPVVVTDLTMPGRGGVWLVREIHRRWPDISVIVVTGGHDIDALPQCLDAGAHHYFLKPVNFDEFHHALKSTLRSQRQRREHETQRRRLEHAVSRQTHRLRRTFLNAIDSLVRTLEARDPGTSGHSLRVRGYAGRLAVRLGLDERARRRLSLAAKLHDIGKVGLSEAILNKAEPLTPEEYDRVKEHPILAERILSPIIRNADTLAAIRGHHERYDGLGYPDGLSGEEIPVLARILTIADCFDALTSNRAYRAALAPEEALRLLEEGRGAAFDPFLVPNFVAMIVGEGMGAGI